MSGVREVLHEAVRGGLARHEAEWALSELLGIQRLDLYSEPREVPAQAMERLKSIVVQRAQGEPLQYLLGSAEFCGSRIICKSGVFIPRPETEAIVQAAIEAFGALAKAQERPLRLVEFGVGSGCIALTLAKAFPACLIVGVEVSWNACSLAAQNVREHGVDGRVQLIQGSWDEAVRGSFDGVIANPPYIPTDHISRLPHDVQREPRTSLDGGTDGLRDIRQVLLAAARLVRPSGHIVLECAETQVEDIAADAVSSGWVSAADTVYDFANRPRGVLLTVEKAPH